MSEQLVDRPLDIMKIMETDEQSVQYKQQLANRMTWLLKGYANNFEFMSSIATMEQEIVLFNIFANERGLEQL